VSICRFPSARVLLTLMVLSCAPVGSLDAQDVRQYLEAPVNPRSGVSCPSPSQYSPLRPDPPGVPTVVGLAVMFQDIPQFNDVAQTMTADAYIFARWRDPRLADPSRGDSSADCPVPAGKELWMPVIEPENMRSRQLFYDQRFLVDGSGTVTLMRRVLVEIANPLDLHDFPFDRHLFRITLWPTISRADEVVFHPLNQWLTINRDLSLLGWQVGAPAASVHESNRVGRLGSFSRYDVVIELVRDWSYYAWKLGVPLFLIVMMAYAVYFIPPSGAAQQLAVGMTSMLTLIAFMLTLGSSLPKISYLTRGDKFFVGCSLIVFLGLLKAILTIVWVQRDAKAVIRWTDRLGRLFYPLAVLLILLYSILI
jgi:hypothetical protein